VASSSSRIGASFEMARAAPGAGAARPTGRSPLSPITGVVARRLGLDELVRRGRLGGGNDIGVAGAEPAQRMLARIVSSNRVSSWLTMAIDCLRLASVTSRTSWPSMRMPAGADVEQPRRQIDHGRLAGARAADREPPSCRRAR
jgi:hypothetical protein